MAKKSFQPPTLDSLFNAPPSVPNVGSKLYQAPPRQQVPLDPIYHEPLAGAGPYRPPGSFDVHPSLYAEARRLEALNPSTYPSNTGTVNPNWTMRGADIEANIRPLGDLLRMAGMQMPREAVLRGEPTLDLREFMGNPQNLAASLLQLGLNRSQVAQALQGSGLVQGLRSGAGMPTSPAQGGPYNEFQFLQGHQLPVQETLSNIANQRQIIPLIQGLMRFAGQSPQSEFASFLNRLPQGAAPAQTRYG